RLAAAMPNTFFAIMFTFRTASDGEIMLPANRLVQRRIDDLAPTGRPVPKFSQEPPQAQRQWSLNSPGAGCNRPLAQAKAPPSLQGGIGGETRAGGHGQRPPWTLRTPGFRARRACP